MYAAHKYLIPFKSYRPRNTSIISLMLKTYNGKYMGDVLASTTRNVGATWIQFVPFVGPIKPYSGHQIIACRSTANGLIAKRMRPYCKLETEQMRCIIVRQSLWIFF